MRLHSLSLKSFRSYSSLDLELSDDLHHVFVGENGSGKTNLIEAITFLSQGRSCLRSDFTDVLRTGEDFFRLRADAVTDEGGTLTNECVFQTSPRRATAYFLGDVRTPLLKFIGAIPSVTFLPQDLDLFTGTPSGRRSFVDNLLSQLTPDFAPLRLEYERVLKQRNALLKRIAHGEASESDLDVWDEELAGHGTCIRKKRTLVLEKIAELLPAELKRLGEDRTDVSVLQLSGSADLRLALRDARQKDVLLQTTTVGPHRDDWVLRSDDRSIAQYFSRGQQRAALLGLLFVSAALFQSIRKEKPVILLDDVLSELDEHHQTALLGHLKDHQVLVTTTHPVPHRTGLRTWAVARGTVIPD